VADTNVIRFGTYYKTIWQTCYVNLFLLKVTSFLLIGLSLVLYRIFVRKINNRFSQFYFLLFSLNLPSCFEHKFRSVLPPYSSHPTCMYAVCCMCVCHMSIKVLTYLLNFTCNILYGSCYCEKSTWYVVPWRRSAYWSRDRTECQQWRLLPRSSSESCTVYLPRCCLRGQSRTGHGQACFARARIPQRDPPRALLFRSASSRTLNY